MSKDDRTFKEKMEDGVFSITYLNNLKSDLESQLRAGKILKINIPSANQKIKDINVYIKSKVSPTETLESDNLVPVKTTRKNITLNTTGVSVKGGDVEVTDEHVARKFLQVKEGARGRGIEFTLNLVSVRNLLKAKRCFYTGLPFDHKDPESSLTFDRIDYKKGYVKGNVVACRKSVNDLKNVLIEHPVSVFKDNPTLLKKVVDKWVI